MPIIGTIASSTRQGQATDLGAMFPLQVVTIGATGVANITFANIPNTYTHLQIRGIYRNTATVSGAFYAVYYQINNDTGNNYSTHYMVGTGSSVASYNFTSQPQGYAGVCTSDGITANMYGTGVIDILDYANTNKCKTIRVLNGTDSNGTGEVFLMSSLWQSTAAVTSIKIYPSTSNWKQFSQVALYGVKSA